MGRHSTIKDFLSRHPHFDEARLKVILRNRINNGLEESGAIKKYFRNLYINEKLFKEWLRNYHAR